ncbi:hypothetical protein H2O64_18195 [Kordia sp. YSTF-M3]|uniref:Bacteriocin n=1 Tax=Kordia aestuariivivens TaxID=2759037 RepID=A0ABR7QDH4_9FLAO|nr:hypothetical protein [Kordia aestuariivivens]MBC8756609.1 hypothetical protein [Kordia aestuariivivens]
MKKKRLKSLSLCKKTISRFNEVNQIVGGEDTVSDEILCMEEFTEGCAPSFVNGCATVEPRLCFSLAPMYCTTTPIFCG